MKNMNDRGVYLLFLHKDFMPNLRSILSYLKAVRSICQNVASRAKLRGPKSRPSTPTRCDTTIGIFNKNNYSHDSNEKQYYQFGEKHSATLHEIIALDN